MAAPMAAPTMASSLIGASSTRPGNSLGQILGRLECAAESAHILSVNEDPRILGQCSGLRFPNGFQVGDAHACVDRAGCSNTSLKCPEAKAHQFSL